MLEIQFGVLCASDDSWDKIKHLVKDFRVSKADKTDDFDHKCVKQFNSREEARSCINQIKNLAGNDIIDITMRVKK